MTVHKALPQYGEDVTLADTPTTWLEGPPLSALDALLIFAGIPLLVIVGVALLVYAPGWVNGPRYRPGQPWDAKREWFGGELAGQPPGATIESGRTGSGDEPGPAAPGLVDEGSGGASAGW